MRAGARDKFLKRGQCGPRMTVVMGAARHHVDGTHTIDGLEQRVPERHRLRVTSQIVEHLDDVALVNGGATGHDLVQLDSFHDFERFRMQHLLPRFLRDQLTWLRRASAINSTPVIASAAVQA